MVTKKELGYTTLGFQADLNGTRYKGDIEVIEKSLTALTQMDRLLKLNEAECVGDADYLISKSENQIEKLQSARLFNKSDRYKKLKDFLKPYFAATTLIFLDFFCQSANDPIEISKEEYAEVEPMLARLYFIEKLIEGRRCKVQLTLFDRDYARDPSLFTDSIQFTRGDDLKISY